LAQASELTLATACGKRTLKTTVATQLYRQTKGLPKLIILCVQAVAQSNTNPSQICDCQSQSNVQNGLTIQSNSNHNSTIFGRKQKKQQFINGQVL